MFPGKSFFSAHEVSTCKISGCLSYRILDSGPDGTQTTLTDRTTKLVTVGCYAWSRNPIYLGMSGLQLSVALCFGSLVGILAVPLFMFVVARLHIHVEEVQLRKRFGLEWERYTQRVRRWL
nr:isoprenylcysteine carboxylmethyltransferase family protein [Escherichia coli]